MKTNTTSIAKANEAFYYYGDHFHIICSWDVTLANLQVWLATRSSANRKFVKPVVHVNGGGGNTWIACEIIRVCVENDIKIIVHTAYSAGVLYTIAKTGDRSQLISVGDHAAVNEQYVTPSERHYLNVQHLEEIRPYSEFFDEVMLTEYMTWRKATFCVKSNYTGKKAIRYERLWFSAQDSSFIRKLQHRDVSMRSSIKTKK